MARMKFELNHAGVVELLKSDGMRKAIEAAATGVSNRAGDGYDVRYGHDRVVAFVETGNEEAIQDNLDNNTLLKAVRG